MVKTPFYVADALSRSQQVVYLLALEVNSEIRVARRWLDGKREPFRARP